ncbi:MAG: hypothetical protein J5J00_02980 [Deltaproteobacteria bacterium]|nr:hypothetical protein [Deltaproteobacteria bacterium]
MKQAVGRDREEGRDPEHGKNGPRNDPRSSNGHLSNIDWRGGRLSDAVHGQRRASHDHSALERYQNLCSRARESVIYIAEDISRAGELQAASLIASLQKKLQNKGPQQDVKIVFATGGTQWLGLTAMIEMLQRWDDLPGGMKSALVECNADLHNKPDMNRVVATHLDTIFPQLRGAHNAYANQLSHIFDKLGIPHAKRHMLYGDVVADPDEVGFREASRAEWRLIMNSVQEEGLLIAEPSRLCEAHPQFKLLLGMQRQAESYGKLVASDGGPDIALFSVGGSYKGQGHIAFNESNTPWSQGVAIDLLSYHAAAGNIKDNCGMHNFYSKDHLPMCGSITLGPADLTSNKDVNFITVVTGKEKRETVKALVELTADPSLPATLLQRGAPGSAIILEPASAGALRLAMHPWDFGTVEWNDDLKAKFFISMALHSGRSIDRLEPSDFLLAAPSSAPIREIRRQNLNSLLSEGSWDELRRMTARQVRDNLVSASQVPQRLGLEQGDLVLHIGPHLDDLSLAAQFLVDEWCRQGQRLVSFYTASGYTAVATPYVVELLQTLRSADAADLALISQAAKDPAAFQLMDRALLNELIRELQSAPYNQDATNYETWKLLTPREKELRAQLLLLRMEHSSCLSGRVCDQDRIAALSDAIAEYERVRPQWGSQDPKIVKEMKVAVRFVEEQTELMARGVDHSDINYPLESSWYGVERNGTARTSDIERVKEIILHFKPRLLVVNGEGFMDHGAHAITQNTVEVAAMELLQEGKLPEGLSLLYYRGVWDRTEIDGRANQLIVQLDQATLRENHESFCRNFRTQAPGLVPDPGIDAPGFFSEQVRHNSTVTKTECEKICGEKLSAAGLLAFNYVTDLSSEPQRGTFLREVSAKVKELERVQGPINRASMKSIIGHEPPGVALRSGDGQRIASVLNSAGIEPALFMNGR